MTLQEWLDCNDVFSHRRESGAVCVEHFDSPNWTGLWHLSDYAVSSVSGSFVWLRPRGES